MNYQILDQPKKEQNLNKYNRIFEGSCKHFLFLSNNIISRKLNINYKYKLFTIQYYIQNFICLFDIINE